jgi:endonuclease YncB( thermonuclease family)
MKKTSIMLTFAVLLSVPIFAQAKAVLGTVEGIVVRVSDGDTVNVQDARGNKLKIRLYGIDAPETEKSSKKTGHISKPGQPFGQEASRMLESLIYHKKVIVEVIDRDRYNRLVALIWLAGENINQEMVAGGSAWAYRQYLSTPYASEFIRLEEQARHKGLGLWNQHNPQPPWEFRRFLIRNKHSKSDLLKEKTRSG